MNRIRRTLTLVAAGALLALGSGQAQAQKTIKLALLQELSGAGATAGTNAKNGAMLAIKEINEAGGILGKKIDATVSDTQSNPGVAKGLATKAVDDDVFAVIGPTFSGSIMVSMRARVDLPQPDSPTMARVLPSSTVKVASATARSTKAFDRNPRPTS